MSRKKSIIDGGNDLECWFCGFADADKLEKHHCLHGTANRALADKYGLTVNLCPECHRGKHGVHGKYGKERDLTLKKVAQRAWEAKYGSRDEFRAVFGKSYIDDDKVAEIASERGCDGC